jgi:hypothetical protein
MLRPILGLQIGGLLVIVCKWSALQSPFRRYRCAMLATVLASMTIDAGRAQSVVRSVPTAVTLSSSASEGVVTLTAAVTATQGAGVPGGRIQFIDDATLAVLGWADVTKPSIVVSRMSPGRHSFHADYSGTSDYLPLVVQPSQSASLIYNERAMPDVSVSTSENPCLPGQVVTLTAKVASSAGQPKGTVTFSDGARVIAAHVGLDQSGAASFTTSALADGMRAITAEYEGDGSYAPAISPRLIQDVAATPARVPQLAQRR